MADFGQSFASSAQKTFEATSQRGIDLIMTELASKRKANRQRAETGKLVEASLATIFDDESDQRTVNDIVTRIKAQNKATTGTEFLSKDQGSQIVDLIKGRKKDRTEAETVDDIREAAQSASKIRFSEDPEGLDRANRILEAATTQEALSVANKALGLSTGDVEKTRQDIGTAERKEQREEVKFEREFTEEGAELQAKLTGQKKATEKEFEATQKLKGAVKRLAVINKQFAKALPTGDRGAFAQRVEGIKAVFGAKTGLKENPELLALKKNARPIAINLIRSFGEVGNLSQSEQQGAIDIINQAGLTDAERNAALRQFIEFSLAAASPDVLDSALKDEDVKAIIDAFEVDLNLVGAPATPEQGAQPDAFNSLGVGESTTLPGGITIRKVSE